MRFHGTGTGLVALGAVVVLGTGAAPPIVGERYEIIRESVTESKSDNGSGSSFDRDTISVSTVASGPVGVEQVYDLPDAATTQDREDNWQLPARIYVPMDGSPPQLRNAAELEGKLDGWLKRGGFTRKNCGKWIFTWNAFKIECDPQSILGVVNGFALQPPVLQAGAPFSIPAGRGPVPLKLTSAKGGRYIYTAEFTLDPNKFRQSAAENDVVVNEILRVPKTLEQAKADRAAMKVSGTVLETFEADGQGIVRKRTSLTKIETQDADGKIETRTITTTLSRKVLPPQNVKGAAL